LISYCKTSTNKICQKTKKVVYLQPITNIMSKICQISGKKVQFGNNVSKAINKTRRRFNANIVSKRFYIPEEDKWISLKVSTSVLKTINKKGISAVLKEARAKGIKV